jgi:hypothetical protein
MPKLSPETPDHLVGDTFVRDYDLGIVQRLGGVVTGEHFFTKVTGVEYPDFPDDFPVVALRRTMMPGVPITLAAPNDATEYWVNPSIIVRRQDPVPAMERWQAGQKLKYVRPAPGAAPVTVVLSKGMDRKTGKVVQRTATGYDAYETKPQPWPFDIPYTILCRAEGNRAESQAQSLLRHIMKRFPPRDNLDVTDSLDSVDGYGMFVDGPTSLSEAMDIAHRVRGWSWSVRVLGYLDIDDPTVEKAVTKPATVNPAQQK